MYVSVAGGKVLLGGAFPKERKMTRDIGKTMVCLMTE